MLDWILNVLTENAVEFGAFAALLAIASVLFEKGLRGVFRANKTTLSAETIELLPPAEAKHGPAVTVAEFIRLRRELKAELEAELAQAESGEMQQLQARISELESQIANPEASLAEAQKRIRDLEEILERAGNQIGGDRITEARAALERGDYSIADELFAEIEAREQMALENAARAAFGRGEVAKAEVRWAAAAAHYVRAASLSATYDHLDKASEFALRAGDFATGLRFAQKMEDKARAEGDKSNLSWALDRAATAFQISGNYLAAEPLYREAVSLRGELEGQETADYAVHLNNLAGLLMATGRYEEAEPLYREALEITRKTVGEAHPDYAIRLNNLAGLLDATERYEDAEPLCREALEIDRKTVGEAHPEYAKHLDNLAGLLGATGRYEEAEPLYREALEIDRKTLGEAHPEYAKRLNNLALLLGATGRYEEAEPLYREALAVSEAALGVDHPSTKGVAENLKRFLANRP